jgi:hypothetical protein
MLTPITFLNVPIDLRRLKEISKRFSLEETTTLSKLVVIGMDQADSQTDIANDSADTPIDVQDQATLDDAIKKFIEGPESGQAFKDLMSSNPKDALKMAMAHLPPGRSESEKNLTEEEYNLLRKRLEAHKYEDFMKVIADHNASIAAEFRIPLASLKIFCPDRTGGEVSASPSPA